MLVPPADVITDAEYVEPATTTGATDGAVDAVGRALDTPLTMTCVLPLEFVWSAIVVPLAEATTEAELAITNGEGATAVFAGATGAGCEAGAAVGVILAADFTDWAATEAAIVVVEVGLTFSVAEGAELTCDVEVSVR